MTVSSIQALIHCVPTLHGHLRCLFPEDMFTHVALQLGKGWLMRGLRLACHGKEVHLCGLQIAHPVYIDNV